MPHLDFGVWSLVLRIPALSAGLSAVGPSCQLLQTANCILQTCADGCPSALYDDLADGLSLCLSLRYSHEIYSVRHKLAVLIPRVLRDRNVAACSAQPNPRLLGGGTVSCETLLYRAETGRKALKSDSYLVSESCVVSLVRQSHK